MTGDEDRLRDGSEITLDVIDSGLDDALIESVWGPVQPGVGMRVVVSGRRGGKSGFLRKVGMLGKEGELRELPE